MVWDIAYKRQKKKKIEQANSRDKSYSKGGIALMRDGQGKLTH